MEINDYCKSVNMELTMWKARLYDVISKIDHLPTVDKQRMYEEVNGLHIIMAELEDRIENCGPSVLRNGNRCRKRSAPAFQD